MAEWKHLTIFDRPYQIEKQAEGLAVSQAVVEGHCSNCGFLKQCSTDCSFKPPVLAWCARRKSEILDGWKGSKENG